MEGSGEDGIGIRAAKILYPLFVGQFFAVIFTTLTFIVVARLLGPSSYGVYTFAFGFSALVNGFLAFGIGAYFSSTLSKLAYKKDGEGMVRTIFSGYALSMIISTVLTLFGIAISGYVAGAYSHIGISPLILMIVSGTIISSVMNAIASSALIGMSRTGLSAILSVSVDILQLLLSIVLTLKFGVLGAVSAMLIGYAIGAAFGFYLVYIAASRYGAFRLYKPAWAELRGIFSFVWPIAATNFLNTGMQNFSIIFLGLYVTTASLGNYGAALKGLTLLVMIHSAFGSGLFPIFNQAKAMTAKEELNKIYNMIIHFALLPMLPLIIFIGVMAGPGLNLLLGQSFNTAPLYLTLIAIGTTIGVFGIYIGNLLISGGYTKSVMKINFMSAAVQLAFLLLLVPSEKVIGAIITIFFIGNLVEAALYAKYAGKLYNIKFEFRKLGLLYLGNIVFGLIIAALLSSSTSLINLSSSHLNYVVYMALGIVEAIILYPLILVLLRAVTEGDIISMRHAASGLGMANRVFRPFLGYSQFLYNVLVRRQKTV